MDAAIAIAGVATGQGVQAGPEVGLVGDVRPAVALGGPVLAHAATGPAF